MKHISKLSSIVAIWMLASTLCLSGGISLPQGWRVPTNVEAQDNWREKDHNRYLLVRADFNGDGILDEAKLLIRDEPPGFGLFAFVSQQDGTFKMFVLDEKKDKSYIRSLGITKVLPGRYKTVCGKGIISCREGEPDEVLVQYDGIDYFKEGSANMYFYWDNLTKDFKKAWIND